MTAKNIILLVICNVALAAQTQTGSQTKTGTSTAKTWSGPLLDASCPDLNSQRPPGSGTSSGTSTSPTGSSASRAKTAQSTGNRSRTDSADSSRYTACRVTSTTASFAIYANGQVRFFDEASNAQIRQQLQSDSNMPSRMLNRSTGNTLKVTVTGSDSGNRVHLSSLTVQP